MIHPSYVELMRVVNDDVVIGEEPVVNSRYSIVCATAKRARQLIDGADPLENNAKNYGKKPLSIAVDELYSGELKILSVEEANEQKEKLNELKERNRELRERRKALEKTDEVDVDEIKAKAPAEATAAFVEDFDTDSEEDLSETTDDMIETDDGIDEE